MLLTKDTTLSQNRYLIVREIALGGMGAVYEAKDQTLGKRVALKQMLHHNQQAQQAFKREGRILAKLSHPALPDVSHYFVENNSQYLVMEHIPGKDLKERLKEQGSFSISQVLDWADQLLDVLEYLHGQPLPIIHRDIKPDNIKLSPRGEIILLDFGISKGGQIYSGPLPTSDEDGSVYAYTEKYASPEQMEAQGTDERSDLYSLGVTLYELLTNKEPIPALKRLQNHHQDPQSFDNLVKNNPNLPVGVLEVLACAMALEADKRPSNAKEMRQMLQRASTSHAQDTPDPKTSIPIPLAQPKEPKAQTVPNKQTPTEAIPTEPVTDRNNDSRFSGPSLWRSRLAVIAVGTVGIMLILLIAITIWPPIDDPMLTFECANGNTQLASADDTVTLAPDDKVKIKLNITPKTGKASSDALEFRSEREFAYRVPLDVDLVNIDFTFGGHGPTTLMIDINDQGGLCGP